MFATLKCKSIRPLRRAVQAAAPALRRTLSTAETAPKSVTQQTSPTVKDDPLVKSAEASPATQATARTQTQLDEELMQKLSSMSGEGGEAGIEYEDGKAVSMKRGVKDQMFRIMPVRDHHH